MSHINHSFHKVLTPLKEKKRVSFFGNIINVKPCIVYDRNIGYTYTIKTTFYYQNDKGLIIPIYVVFTLPHKKNKNKDKRIYEWWKKYNGMYKKWIYDVNNWEKQNEIDVMKIGKEKYVKMFEKWVSDNKLEPINNPYAPIKIYNATKSNQTLGTNQYFKHIEKKSKYIIFVHINSFFKYELLKNIPKNNLRVLINKNTTTRYITI